MINLIYKSKKVYGIKSQNKYNYDIVWIKQLLV